MKKIAFDSYEDVRAKFKHQTLLQDYVELQQETEAARNKFMALKQKKLTLEAEVRFLRRRHKFLLKNKSSTLQEQVFMNPQPTQFRKSKKEKVHIEKQKTLRHLLPSKKKKTPQNIQSPEFDLILGNSSHGVKQQTVQRVIANQRVRVNGPKGYPFLDLRQKDIFGSQEPVSQSQSQTRKPVIDLNQISREEEEELQDQCQPFEPLTQDSIRNGFDEQHTDLRFSVDRNVGGGSGLGSGLGSSGRVGKRKISWQDPVALTV